MIEVANTSQGVGTGWAGWATAHPDLVGIENHIIGSFRLPIYCLPTHYLIASYAPGSPWYAHCTELVCTKI